VEAVERIRTLAPVALSLLLILVVAGAGFVATRAASNRSQNVHIQDRSQEQATLAGLGTQYVLFGFKEEINFSTSHTWSARPGDPSDTAQLREYAGQSALLGYGAALVDPATGSYVSSSVPVGELPRLVDPEMAPLLEALRHRGPGLSSVDHVGTIPLVAYGVPLTVAGRTVGFVGFSRADQSPLETYVAHLHFGRTGVSYLVDSRGVAVAASDTAAVGHPIGAIAPILLLGRGKGGFTQYGPSGDREVATFDPIGVGGWGSLTTQSASEFFGPIDSGIVRVEGAGVLFLVVAASLIALFVYRRHTALRREMRTMNELAEARERFRHAFEETPVGMALIGVTAENTGRFLQVNQALCQLTGFTAGELLERSFTELVHPENAREVRISAERLFTGNTSFELEIRMATKSGDWRWSLLHGSLIRDTTGRPLYGVVHVEDVSGRKAAEQRLAHLALHDPLTGLANRVLVADRLTRALAVGGRYGNQVGVLYLDLDNFKDINDRFGHETGDRVLKEVAQRLRMAVRPEDTPGRLGGDEFVVVCAGLREPAVAVLVAERVEAAVSAPMEVDGAVLSVCVSTGISIGGGPDAYADQLLRDADAAMYMAKRNGRGRVELAEVV
jgi:diguanylate cyclase (GGDEF)-like protein/PAS domain S-box-containing protein